MIFALFFLMFNYVKSQQFLVTFQQDRNITYFSIDRQEIAFNLEKSINSHLGQINQMTLSKDRVSMITSDNMGFIKKWSLYNKMFQENVPNQNKVSLSVLQYSLDGINIYTISDEKNAVFTVYKTINYQIIYQQTFNDYINTMKQSPLMNQFAFASNNGSIFFWKKLSERNFIFEFELVSPAGEALTIDYSNDGKFLISGHKDGSVIHWDTFSQKIIFIYLAHIGQITALKYSPDGTFFVSSAIDRKMYKWDPSIGNYTMTYNLQNSLTSIQFSDNSRTIYTSDQAGFIIFWNHYTGTYTQSNLQSSIFQMVKAYSFCGNQQFYDFNFQNKSADCQQDCTLPLMKDFEQNICARNCPASSNFYNIGNGTCVKCDYRCSSCTSGTNYDCQSCMNGYYSILNEQLCSDDPYDCRLLGNVPYTFYGNQRTKQCQLCDEPFSKCIKCWQPDKCWRCRDETKFASQEGECIDNCPELFQFNNLENKKCEYCQEGCRKCLNATYCLDCMEGYYTTEQMLCTLKCPNGTYSKEEDKTCIDCKYPCKNCVNDIICTSCLQGMFLDTYQLTKDVYCYNECVEGYFFNIRLKPDQCSQCLPPCFGCSEQYTCTSCKKPQFLYNQNCIPQCPDGFYGDPLTRVCKKCMYPCKFCLNEKQCLSCQDDLWVDEINNNSCTTYCNPGTYPLFTINNKVCKLCVPPCSTCTNEDQCLSCIEPLYFFAPRRSCVDECPQNFKPNATSLIKMCSATCIVPCDECFEIRENQCKSCLKPYLLWGRFCLLACPATTYQPANTVQCVSCVNFTDTHFLSQGKDCILKINNYVTIQEIKSPIILKLVVEYASKEFVNLLTTENLDIKIQRPDGTFQSSSVAINTDVDFPTDVFMTFTYKESVVEDSLLIITLPEEIVKNNMQVFNTEYTYPSLVWTKTLLSYIQCAESQTFNAFTKKCITIKNVEIIAQVNKNPLIIYLIVNYLTDDMINILNSFTQITIQGISKRHFSFRIEKSSRRMLQGSLTTNIPLIMQYDVQIIGRPQMTIRFKIPDLLLQTQDFRISTKELTLNVVDYYKITLSEQQSINNTAAAFKDGAGASKNAAYLAMILNPGSNKGARSLMIMSMVKLVGFMYIQFPPSILALYEAQQQTDDGGTPLLWTYQYPEDILDMKAVQGNFALYNVSPYFLNNFGDGLAQQFANMVFAMTVYIVYNEFMRVYNQAEIPDEPGKYWKPEKRQKILILLKSIVTSVHSAITWNLLTGLTMESIIDFCFYCFATIVFKPSFSEAGIFNLQVALFCAPFLFFYPVHLFIIVWRCTKIIQYDANQRKKIKFIQFLDEQKKIKDKELEELAKLNPKKKNQLEESMAKSLISVKARLQKVQIQLKEQMELKKELLRQKMREQKFLQKMMNEENLDGIKSKDDTDKNKMVPKRNYIKEVLYFFINFYNPQNGQIYLSRHGCLIEDFRDLNPSQKYGSAMDIARYMGLLIFTVLYPLDKPFQQISLYSMCNLIFLFYLGWVRPHSDFIDFCILFPTEFMVNVANIGACLIAYEDYMGNITNVEYRIKVGGLITQSVMGITYISIISSLLQVGIKFYSIVQTVYLGVYTFIQKQKKIKLPPVLAQEQIQSTIRETQIEKYDAVTDEQYEILNVQDTKNNNRRSDFDRNFYKEEQFRKNHPEEYQQQRITYLKSAKSKIAEQQILIDINMDDDSLEDSDEDEDTKRQKQIFKELARIKEEQERITRKEYVEQKSKPTLMKKIKQLIAQNL